MPCSSTSVRGLRSAECRARSRRLPDVLVLGAGGTLGIAWLRGIVTGIEDGTGLDLRDSEYFVGTSAGAYVAAYLAAGKRVEDPGVVHDASVEPHDRGRRAPGPVPPRRRLGCPAGRRRERAASSRWR